MLTVCFIFSGSEIAPPGYPQFLIFNKETIPANSGFEGINFLIQDFLFSAVGVLGLIAGGCICISGGGEARRTFASRHPFTQCSQISLGGDRKASCLKGLYVGSLPNAAPHPRLLAYFHITLVVVSWPVRVKYEHGEILVRYC
jgi:hypothetical protein